MFCGFETHDDREENEYEETQYKEKGDESDDSLEIDREEMEIALYSKLHFVQENVDTLSVDDSIDNRHSVYDNYHTSVFVDANHDSVSQTTSNQDKKKTDGLRKPGYCVTDIKPHKIKYSHHTKHVKQERSRKEPSKDQVIVVDDSESDSCSKYGLKSKTEQKTGLSLDQAVEISDSEPNIDTFKMKNNSEKQNVLYLDLISSDSVHVTVSESSDTDIISSDSDFNSVSSDSDNKELESIRRWSSKNSQLLCDDMILDETLSDPGELQFNVNKGQEKLLSLPKPSGNNYKTITCIQVL